MEPPDPLPNARTRLAAQALFRAAVGFAYPALCLGCDGRLPPDADGRDAGSPDALPLCPSCLRHLPRAEPEEVAARLGRLPDDAPPLGAAWALWAFDAGGTVRRLQHVLKYRNRPALGVTLGRLMGDGLLAARPGEGYNAVVPVPLGRPRMLERGYNQSRQLALGVADALASSSAPPVLGPLRPEVLDALVRARPTRTQTALSRARRWANVSGAFALTPGTDVDGLRLLLVDDVLTTGATLAAAAAPLIASGACVDAATLAVAAV